MSSDNAQSIVTYTSISSNSDGASWGIPLMNAGELSEMDPYEEVAQQGQVHPLSPAYVPDPMELDAHVPVYVPEPEHLEYHAPSDDDIQVEDDNEDPEEDPILVMIPKLLLELLTEHRMLVIIMLVTRQGTNDAMTPESIQAMIDRAIQRNSPHTQDDASQSHDAAYVMTWGTLKKKLMDKYCPKGEIKKLEIELWNLMVKGNDVAAYTQR
nr:reverse transcriptase domain-containing protein [Tanacetum cinerariifolium]